MRNVDAESHQRELSDAVLKGDSITYKSRLTIIAITEWLVCMLSWVTDLDLACFLRNFLTFTSFYYLLTNFKCVYHYGVLLLYSILLPLWSLTAL